MNALELLPDQRWCSTCQKALPYQRFDRHVKTCSKKAKPTSIAGGQIKRGDNQYTSIERHEILRIPYQEAVNDREVEEFQCDDENNIESEDDDSLNAADLEQPITLEKSDNTEFNMFIEVHHHPHSGKHTPTVIALDKPITPHRHATSVVHPSIAAECGKPWAPFRTRADFELSEQVVTKCLERHTVNVILGGFHGKWAGKTTLTLRSYADMQASLAAARKFGVQFQHGEVVHKFQNHEYTFEFRFRDPWEWILDLVTDSMLTEQIMWYPVQKYLNDGHRISRIYDELNSGDTWWEIQDSLPQEDGMPHCFLPLHLWLDKSNVAKTVKMHPILLRPGFLPSQVRNSSGNGGGVLIGYMPIVFNPNENADTDHVDATSVKVAQFKREVYHKVFDIILKSLRKPSRYGEAVKCGDGVVRVLFPGFLIHAVDGEEACSTCSCRGPQSKHPCARCLVPKVELHVLSKISTPRTQSSMKAVYKEAIHALTYKAQEQILRDTGLHLVKNAFWQIGNSDPYAAYSYDLLHAFDSGEWGKHQWPLILDILTSQEKAGLSKSMAKVPRWRGLKHFKYVTSTEFSDGNSYRDILKSILPSLVDFFPSNSPIIHAIRLLGILRTIAGLSVVTEAQIEFMESCLPKYEKCCQEITHLYKKNYDYPKHHSLLHLSTDIRNKGATVNYSTRQGEGFQQEVQQAYDQTNFRNVESQMVRIDENQEVIAQIRMFVDLQDQKIARKLVTLDETDGDKIPAMVEIHNHWAVGSPLRTIYISDYQEEHEEDAVFRNFEVDLRSFLFEVIDESCRPSPPYKITPYQCLYITYRSMEDWREQKDILRCSANFHGHARYDCVAINTDPISFGRLKAIFKCQGGNGKHVVVTLVKQLKPSSWKSRTKWDGCRVFEEKGHQFVLPDYLIRGCLMMPAAEKSGKMFYLNDIVDSDAFLRFYL